MYFENSVNKTINNMKTRLFVLGAILMFLGFGAKAQVNIMYDQGFEVSDPVNYTVTPSTGFEYSTDLYVSGERSIKLVQAKNDDIVYVTDTIDFTTYSSAVRFVSLEFDHICNVETNSGSDVQIGKIYVKLAQQSDAAYRELAGTEYNQDREGYSTEFRNTGTFNKESYSEWRSGTVSNSSWKSERFDINDILTSSVPMEERQLIFRFVLKKRTKAGSVTGTGWWIDNLRVRASQNQMIRTRPRRRRRARSRARSA